MLAFPLRGAGGPDKLTLLVPLSGVTLRTNTPTLAWSAVPSDRFEVWIDGIQMAGLPGDRTTYVPFPLSFGEHRWRVVAQVKNVRLESEEGHFTVDDAPLARLPAGAVLLRQHWAVQSAETAGSDGARLSSPDVKPEGWAATSVPATVLTALVRNGVYPNPYVELNNTRIPDAHDGFNADFGLLKYSHIPGKNPWAEPYWFRTSFSTPANYTGKQVWLTFNEINYRAEVWLNGVRLSDPKEMVGMDRAFRFDVTKLLHTQSDNYLAVAIHPVDVPGRPEPAPVTPLADPGRNMGADPDISLNYTKWDAIGWDWQPEIHDRDMGITEDVFLSATGDVEIANTYIASDLALPEAKRAALLLRCDVINHTAAPRTGKLHATVADQHGVAVQVEQELTLAPGETKSVEWTSATKPEFFVDQPRLWWPAALGEPHLYQLSLEFRERAGSTVAEPVPFGIRKLETLLSTETQSRIFKVNGRVLYGQGGNWVIDMMLNWTASRYEQEIAIAREANLNFLRIWGPTGAPPDSFYDAADRLGVLLQQDFLHDHWGTERNKPGYAPPEDIFEKATTAIIKRYRNHPSLFLWCGGNEGPNPREELIKHKLLPAFDPWGTRYYLSASLEDGLQGGGPYHNIAARSYFDHPKIRGFNSEIGPSGVPEWESLRQFLSLPPTDWAENRFPVDGQWAYHDATDRAGANEDRKYSHLDDLIRQRFGAPATNDLAGVRDYAAKAQLLNFETYRAPMEALNQHLWRKSTGFALWKFNSSWPSVLWQVTDWYEQLHAGTYSLRHALEPLHVQLNLNDRTVSIVNRTEIVRPGLVVRAELFDAAMKSIWRHDQEVDAAELGATTVSWTVPAPTALTFLKLRLLDQGKSVSENFYWLAPEDNFTALAQLPPATIVLQASATKAGQPVKVTVTNRGQGLALMVRLRLIDAPSGVEALPTYWTDNYLNLLPGESVEVSATPQADGLPARPAIEVSGFNVPAARVAF